MNEPSLARCSRCHRQLQNDGTCRVCRHHVTVAAAATAPPAATVAIDESTFDHASLLNRSTPAASSRQARRSDLGRWSTPFPARTRRLAPLQREFQAALRLLDLELGD